MSKIAILNYIPSWDGNYRVRIYETDISDITLVDWANSSPDDFEEVIRVKPFLDKSFNVQDVSDIDNVDRDIILDRLDMYGVDFYFPYAKGVPKARSPLKVKKPKLDLRRVVLISRREGEDAYLIGNLSVSVKKIKQIIDSDLPPGWLYQLTDYMGGAKVLQGTRFLPNDELATYVSKRRYKTDPDGVLIFDTANYRGAHSYRPLKPSGKI